MQTVLIKTLFRSLLLVVGAVFASHAQSAEGTVRYHLPEDALLTMADGTSKKVSDVRPGEPVRCFRAGRSTATEAVSGRIRRIECSSGNPMWLTALYLRPADRPLQGQSTSPLVPAMQLETAPTLSVTTSEGTKTVSQLRKGDVLYRFNPDTQQMSTWKVSIIHPRARWVNTLYAVETTEGSYLVENMLAID